MENKPMEIYDFANLMLAYLARQSKLNGFKTADNQHMAFLPANYKQIIECIMTAKNGWKDKFSILIDTEQYFDDHFLWEGNLASAILEVAKDLDKKIEFNFYADFLVIPYSDCEIDTIVEKYQDKQLNETMDHFVNLLTAYIFSRSFQERHCDYFAEAVETMKRIENRDEKTTVDDILKLEEQKQEEKIGFVKKNR